MKGSGFRFHGSSSASRPAGAGIRFAMAVSLFVTLNPMLALPAAAQTAPDPPDSAEPTGPRPLAFRVAKVVSMDDRDSVVNNATVLVKGGRIEAVGPSESVEVPDGYRVVEMPEAWLVPGLVDAHNHTAGGDFNDMVYLTNPGLNTRAGIEPGNARIKRAASGGVTAVLFIPGSGTNISGFGSIVKTAGANPDEVFMRSPGSLKIAQAGNPEWYFGGVRRMFMNWNTRQTLLKARAYHRAWEAFEKGETAEKPEYDPIFDDFRGLFRGEYPLSVHTQWYQVLLTTVEQYHLGMKLWTVLDHCTFNAWKVGPIVAETDCWTINGPRQYEFDRTARRMIGNASGWWKNGVRRLGINTDAVGFGGIPQHELSFQAAMACWYGWLPYPALRGVTQIPAEALGVHDRIGSIEAGKDADFGIWTGDPLDPRSACLITVIDGKIAHDGTKGIRRF